MKVIEKGKYCNLLQDSDNHYIVEIIEKVTSVIQDYEYHNVVIIDFEHFKENAWATFRFIEQAKDLEFVEM